ncbi:MAG: hypothetical protein QM791_13555 [Ferruginibacter sp.]
MLKPFLLVLFFGCVYTGNLHAQDTLPRILVKNISGKIIISWKNTYGARINNINIQRSYDSLRNFTTIGSVLEPMNRENGFVDSKPPTDSMFYRVFIAFEGGRYIFTKSARPFKDTISTIPKNIVEYEKVVTPKGFIPSRFVYTGRDNNVVLNLPDPGSKKYSIKFFDENEKPVFELAQLTEPYLILEKVNFKRSGWYYFELYSNGKLEEKHKFFIPKEERKQH